MAVWEISDAIYSNIFKDISPQDSDPVDIAFNPTGSILYILGFNNGRIFQYSLSTPWDVSTASYTGKSFDLRNEDWEPQSVDFSSDGSLMTIIGSQNDRFYQYALSTPWDVSTASYTGEFLKVNKQDTSPIDMVFSLDGLNVYMLGSTTFSVYQYTLSTPFDISTAGHSVESFYIGTQDIYSYDVSFSSDGTKMYIVGNTYDLIYQYALSTAWDVSTASYTGKSFYIGNQEPWPIGLAFDSDGEKMYLLGLYNIMIYQYSLVGPPPPPPKKEASRTGVYSFKTLKV